MSVVWQWVGHQLESRWTFSSSVGSYLYQESVQRTLRPFSLESDRKRGTGGGKDISQLPFTLSLGGRPSLLEEGGGSDPRETFLLCEECSGRVELLERLQEQLGSCKKQIAAQVEQIDNSWGQSPSAAAAGEMRGQGQVGQRKGKLQFLQRIGLSEDGLSVACSGTGVGGDNISQVLRSLGSLCEGIPKSPSVSTTGPHGDLQMTPPSATHLPMEGYSSQDENHWEPGSSGELVESNIKLFPALPDGNSKIPENLGDTLVAEVGKVFSSPVKLEPVWKEPEITLSPSTSHDPEYPLDFKDHLAEEEEGHCLPESSQECLLPTPPISFSSSKLPSCPSGAEASRSKIGRVVTARLKVEGTNKPGEYKKTIVRFAGK